MLALSSQKNLNFKISILPLKFKIRNFEGNSIKLFIELSEFY